MATPIETTATAVEKYRKEARALARRESIGYCHALDRVAQAHDYNDWKHVVHCADDSPIIRAIARHEPTRPGELPGLATAIRLAFEQDRALAVLQFPDLYAAERAAVAAGVVVCVEREAQVVSMLDMEAVEFAPELCHETWVMHHLRNHPQRYPKVVRSLRGWITGMAPPSYWRLIGVPADISLAKARTLAQQIGSTGKMIWLRGTCYFGNDPVGELPPLPQPLQLAA